MLDITTDFIVFTNMKIDNNIKLNNLMNRALNSEYSEISRRIARKAKELKTEMLTRSSNKLKETFR